MRTSHDLREDLTLLTTNKVSGGQQLFGSNNLVVAGPEQEKWTSYFREVNRASERCKAASRKLIVRIEPLNDLEIIGAGEIDGRACHSRNSETNRELCGVPISSEICNRR